MVTLHNNNYRQSNICSLGDYLLDLSTGKQKLSTGQIINSYPQVYPQSYPHVDSQQRGRACRQHKPFEQMFERSRMSDLPILP